MKREERNGNKTHLLPAKVNSIYSTWTQGLRITYFYNMPLYICSNKTIKFDNLNWKKGFSRHFNVTAGLELVLETSIFQKNKVSQRHPRNSPGLCLCFPVIVDQRLIHTSIISQLCFCLAPSHLLQVTCRWSRSHRTSCTSFPCQPSPSYGILPVCCTQGTRILILRSLFWLQKTFPRIL